MMKQNTCKVVAGRLLEVRVAAGYGSVSDVDDMIAMILAAFARISEPTRIVIAADWRACRVLTPEVAARVSQMLSRVNPRVQRSAILHGGHATGVLQAIRLTREAQLIERRVFTDAQETETWLDEVLTQEERARLKIWLVPPHSDSAS